jgi:hypothetical protein
MTSDDSDGVASYQGYEYQILATVWLSLELLFHQRNCSLLVVEPASGEDVAANLEVPAEAAVSKVTLALTPQSIEIQIKLRQTDHWTPAGFREIVRGSAESASAIAPMIRIRPITQLLAQPTVQFVLLTNAQVNRELRPFLIQRIGDNSAAVTIPGKPAPGESSETARRVAILQQQHPEVLRARIENLLQQAGVPFAERRACADKLQEEVRSRLLRKAPPKFTRDKLFALLRAFDGLPPTAPGEFFVAPENFGDIASRLDNEHRLAIVGPPGMGKTLTAQELVRQHRAAADAFKVVTEAAGPGGISECLNRHGRYLFFLEDPWGQFKLSVDADRWVSELPKLFLRASSDKRFLLTTRTAIQNTAFASRVPQQLAATQCVLNDSHYTAAQRRAILERASASAAPWQRDFLQQHRDQILRSLTAPYSLTLFAVLLMRATTEQEVQLEKLIRDCNIEVIGSTVAAEIRALGRESIASTIALWAWMMVDRKINLQITDELRRTIREGGFTGEIDVRKLLTYLAQAQWFHEHDGDFTVHPAILEGLELVVTQEPGLTEEVLTRLLEGFAKQNRGDLAHRIRRSLTGRQLPLPPRVQAAIDSYLLSRLTDASRYDFTEAFGDLATGSRSAAPVAILARALYAKPTRGGILGYEPWQPPALSEVDLQCLRDSTDARQFAGKFVRIMLSSESGAAYRSPHLQAFFSQLGWNLAADYLLAVEEGLEHDNIHVEAAIAGAVAAEPSPYDNILDAALGHYDSTCQWWEKEQETYRQARQAEMNADYASHIEEQPQERFAPSDAVLKETVALRIRRQGYDWLGNHPRRDDLLDAWAESVTPATSLAELDALAQACQPSRQWIFFKAAEKSKNKQLASTIWKSMSAAGDAATHGWHALLLLLTSDELEPLVSQTTASLSLVRRLELTDAVVATRPHEVEDAEAKVDRTINVLLNVQERRLWEATHPKQIGILKLPAEDAEFFRASLQATAGSSSSDELATRAAFQLANWGDDITAYLPRLLTSESSDIRVNALKLLRGRHDAEARGQLYTGLADKDYHCRREAMTVLAEDATEPEKQAILAMARDPSAPVRETCAELIRHYQWDDAQPILLELLMDRRSNQHGVGLFRSQFPSFHVARAAAQALAAFTDRAHVTAVQAVQSLLAKRQPSEDDPLVHYYALEFLAGVKTPEVIVQLGVYLSDDWHVGGMKHEGFPLRYVAAWGLLTQLFNDDSVSEVVSVDALYEAARHNDQRLAGPCLACLGLCGQRAMGHVVQLCRTESLSVNRAALLRVALALANTEAPPELAKILSGHPVNSLIQAAQSETIVDEAGWTQFCEANPAEREWIGAIQTSEDTNSVLRLVLFELFKQRIENAFSRNDLRADELPESLPIMNLRTMKGGE